MEGNLMPYDSEKEQAIAKLVEAKKSAERIFQHMLDLGLIKSWYYNGTFHVELPYDETKPKEPFGVALLNCSNHLISPNDYPYDFPYALDQQTPPEKVKQFEEEFANRKSRQF